MREMSEAEELMYRILKNNKMARDSNWEAVRLFYLEKYGINLPKLEGKEAIWTVERMIRTLKALYPKDLTDAEERQIKAEKEMQYKEQALDRNKPIKPAERPKNEPQSEQTTLGLFGEWW